MASEILKRLTGRQDAFVPWFVKRNDIMHATPKAGLEFVEADFDDPASLRKALKDVQRAFLVTNSSDRVGRTSVRFVSLARESGVEAHRLSLPIARLLNLSAALSALSRCSRRGASRVGMTYTSLRPNLYMQGLLMIGKSIASQGRFFAPRAMRADKRSRCSRYSRSRGCGAAPRPDMRARRIDLTGPEALTACGDGCAALRGTRSTDHIRRRAGAGISRDTSRLAHARLAGRRPGSRILLTIAAAKHPASRPPSERSPARIPAHSLRSHATSKAAFLHTEPVLHSSVAISGQHKSC